MAGFEAYNSAGKLTIDGTYKPAMISSLSTMGTMTDQGYYQITNPFVDAYSFGYLPQNFYPNPSARWVRLNAGAACFAGADQFMPNSGQMMISSQSNGVSSGYLDVFNASGNLIWSAVSAASVPRVLDFIDIPAGYDLQNNTYSKSLSFQPWFLQNACPGNISDDGTVVGLSGLVLYWTGSAIQCRYIVKNQRAYSATVQSQGLKIPLAYFTGY
jgi:hypothetical protein